MAKRWTPEEDAMAMAGITPEGRTETATASRRRLLTAAAERVERAEALSAFVATLPRAVKRRLPEGATYAEYSSAVVEAATTACERAGARLIATRDASITATHVAVSAALDDAEERAVSAAASARTERAKATAEYFALHAAWVEQQGRYYAARDAADKVKSRIRMGGATHDEWLAALAVMNTIQPDIEMAHAAMEACRIKHNVPGTDGWPYIETTDQVRARFTDLRAWLDTASEREPYSLPHLPDAAFRAHATTIQDAWRACRLGEDLAERRMERRIDRWLRRWPLDDRESEAA